MFNLLPSEIARLILGYLEDKGYEKSVETMLKELPELQELFQMRKKGLNTTARVMDLTLLTIIEDYCQAKQLIFNVLEKHPLNFSKVDRLHSLSGQLNSIFNIVTDKLTKKSTHAIKSFRRNVISKTYNGISPQPLANSGIQVMATNVEDLPGFSATSSLPAKVDVATSYEVSNVQDTHQEASTMTTDGSAFPTTLSADATPQKRKGSVRKKRLTSPSKSLNQAHNSQNLQDKFLKKIMEDTKLHEKLAEYINSVSQKGSHNVPSFAVSFNDKPSSSEFASYHDAAGDTGTVTADSPSSKKDIFDSMLEELEKTLAPNASSIEKTHSSNSRSLSTPIPGVSPNIPASDGLCHSLSNSSCRSSISEADASLVCRDLSLPICSNSFIYDCTAYDNFIKQSDSSANKDDHGMQPGLPPTNIHLAGPPIERQAMFITEGVSSTSQFPKFQSPSEQKSLNSLSNADCHNSTPVTPGSLPSGLGPCSLQKDLVGTRSNSNPLRPLGNERPGESVNSVPLDEHCFSFEKSPLQNALNIPQDHIQTFNVTTSNSSLDRSFGPLPVSSNSAVGASEGFTAGSISSDANKLHVPDNINVPMTTESVDDAEVPSQWTSNEIADGTKLKLKENQRKERKSSNSPNRSVAVSNFHNLLELNIENCHSESVISSSHSQDNTGEYPKEVVPLSKKNDQEQPSLCTDTSIREHYSISPQTLQCVPFEPDMPRAEAVIDNIIDSKYFSGTPDYPSNYTLTEMQPASLDMKSNQGLDSLHFVQQVSNSQAELTNVGLVCYSQSSLVRVQDNGHSVIEIPCSNDQSTITFVSLPEENLKYKVISPNLGNQNKPCAKPTVKKKRRRKPILSKKKISCKKSLGKKNYLKEDLEKAIHEVYNSDLAIAHIASKYKIPRKTLSVNFAAKFPDRKRSSGVVPSCSTSKPSKSRGRYVNLTKTPNDKSLKKPANAGCEIDLVGAALDIAFNSVTNEGLSQKESSPLSNEISKDGESPSQKIVTLALNDYESPLQRALDDIVQEFEKFSKNSDELTGVDSTENAAKSSSNHQLESPKKSSSFDPLLAPCSPNNKPASPKQHKRTSPALKSLLDYSKAIFRQDKSHGRRRSSSVHISPAVQQPLIKKSSYSTPRRHSHIRALDFDSPSNEKSPSVKLSSRKAKAISHLKFVSPSPSKRILRSTTSVGKSSTASSSRLRTAKVLLTKLTPRKTPRKDSPPKEESKNVADDLAISDDSSDGCQSYQNRAVKNAHQVSNKSLIDSSLIESNLICGGKQASPEAFYASPPNVSAMSYTSATKSSFLKYPTGPYSDSSDGTHCPLSERDLEEDVLLRPQSVTPYNSPHSTPDEKSPLSLQPHDNTNLRENCKSHQSPKKTHSKQASFDVSLPKTVQMERKMTLRSTNKNHLKGKTLESFAKDIPSKTEIKETTSHSSDEFEVDFNFKPKIDRITSSKKAFHHKKKEKLKSSRKSPNCKRKIKKLPNTTSKLEKSATKSPKDAYGIESKTKTPKNVTKLEGKSQTVPNKAKAPQIIKKLDRKSHTLPNKSTKSERIKGKSNTDVDSLQQDQNNNSEDIQDEREMEDYPISQKKQEESQSLSKDVLSLNALEISILVAENSSKGLSDELASTTLHQEGICPQILSDTPRSPLPNQPFQNWGKENKFDGTSHNLPQPQPQNQAEHNVHSKWKESFLSSTKKSNAPPSKLCERMSKVDATSADKSKSPHSELLEGAPDIVSTQKPKLSSSELPKETSKDGGKKSRRSSHHRRSISKVIILKRDIKKIKSNACARMIDYTSSPLHATSSESQSEVHEESLVKSDVEVPPSLTLQQASKKHRTYTEKDMEMALREISSTNSSFSRIAAKYNIPRTTLSLRFKSFCPAEKKTKARPKSSSDVPPSRKHIHRKELSPSFSTSEVSKEDIEKTSNSPEYDDIELQLAAFDGEAPNLQRPSKPQLNSSLSVIFTPDRNEEKIFDCFNFSSKVESSLPKSPSKFVPLSPSTPEKEIEGICKTLVKDGHGVVALPTFCSSTDSSTQFSLALSHCDQKKIAINSHTSVVDADKGALRHRETAEESSKLSLHKTNMFDSQLHSPQVVQSVKADSGNKSCAISSTSSREGNLELLNTVITEGSNASCSSSDDGCPSHFSPNDPDSKAVSDEEEEEIILAVSPFLSLLSLNLNLVSTTSPLGPSVDPPPSPMWDQIPDNEDCAKSSLVIGKDKTKSKAALQNQLKVGNKPAKQKNRSSVSFDHELNPDAEHSSSGASLRRGQKRPALQLETRHKKLKSLEDSTDGSGRLFGSDKENSRRQRCSSINKSPKSLVTHDEYSRISAVDPYYLNLNEESLCSIPPTPGKDTTLLLARGCNPLSKAEPSSSERL